MPILPAFLETDPKVTVDLSPSDAVVDLIEERADVTIRIGALEDTALRARLLGRSRMHVVAAPSYLARRGISADPQALDGHNCLNFNFRRPTDRWPFREDGAPTARAIAGNFQGNSGEVGRLMPILENFNPGDLEEVHALYVGHQRLSVRVRAFVDFLAEHVRL